MTEKEYILVRNLANITNALQVLRDVLPDSDGIVTKDKLQPILSQLAQWQDKAHEKVNIKA